MTTENTGGADNQTTAADTNTSNTGEGQSQQQPNLGAVRKAGQKEVLDVLNKVTGQQFGNTRDAASFVESLLKAQTDGQNGGNEQPKKETTSNKANGEMAELRQMIQALNSKLEEKDTIVRKTSLQSQIKDAAVKSGFDPQYLDLASSLFEQQIAFDTDGSFYVKGKDGSVKLDNNGDAYTLDKLAQEILKSRPKLANEQPRTGTGTKFGFSTTSPGGEMPDAATDPEGWKAWKTANGHGAKGGRGIGVSVVRRTLG
jgi:hypothetical protein